MAKVYRLNGVVSMVDMAVDGVVKFIGAVANEIPTASMGTVRLHVKAEGADVMSVEATSVEELKKVAADFSAKAKQPVETQATSVVYDLQATVALINISQDDGVDVVDAAIHNMPPDSLKRVIMESDETA